MDAREGGVQDEMSGGVCVVFRHDKSGVYPLHCCEQSICKARGGRTKHKDGQETDDVGEGREGDLPLSSPVRATYCAYLQKLPDTQTKADRRNAAYRTNFQPWRRDQI